MTKTKKRIICAVIAWLAVAAWGIFIFSMSADNAEESSEKSGEVVDLVAGIVVPGYDDMTPEEKTEAIKPLSFPIRKLAHISEYTVLGALLAIAVFFTPKLEVLWARTVLPFVIGVAYASTDEYHQSLVPGRGPSVWDVCIDATGVILGVCAVFAVTEYFKNGKSKNLSE